MGQWKRSFQVESSTSITAAAVRASPTETYCWWHKSCITFRTLHYGNYGIFHVMGNAGFISPTAEQRTWQPYLHPQPKPQLYTVAPC